MSEELSPEEQAEFTAALDETLAEAIRRIGELGQEKIDLHLRMNELERRANDLLRKFHRETDCGADGMHWNECEQLAHILETGLHPWREP